jgi:hypothetical protein
MDLRLVEYVTYLAVSVGLTLWVGRTLYRNGGRFLADALGDAGLADAVNRLLLVGFYLLSLGGAALLINAGATLASVADVVQAIVTKLGLLLLVLGTMHVVNLLVFHRLRQPAGPRSARDWH